MKRSLILSCLVTMTIGTGYSQISIPTSLEQAVASALEKSATLKNQEHEVKKLDNERKGVWNKYIPHVSGTALYAYLDNDLTIDIPTATTPILGLEFFDGKQTVHNSINAFHAGLTATFPIFTGLQIPNGAKALEQKKLGTYYLMESEKDQITKDVINSFDQIFLLDEAEKLIKDSETRLEKETQRVEKAIALGLAIPYDRDKIKYATLELNSKKVEIKGKRNVLYQKISYLTNYTPEEIESVIYTLEPYIIFEEALTAENKQEVKALEAYKSALEYVLKKEKGTYFPTLGAFAGLSYTSFFDVKNGTTVGIGGLEKDINLKLNELTLSPNWMVGLALKWDIFSGFERKHKVEEAKINIAQMNNTIDDTKEKLELLLKHNYSNYEVMLEKIAIADQQEKVAKNNLKMAVKQYQEGLISISDRLEAENDTFKAALNKVNVIIDQRLAAIETLLTTGELNKYMTKNNN